MKSTGSANVQLVVEGGAQSGMLFAIDKPFVTVGRANDNDIVLNDEMVSKHHARIIIQGNNYLIEDLGSSNGTTVNGQQVKSHILSNGDKLYLGQTNLTFNSVVPAGATQPMAAGVPVPTPPIAPVQAQAPVERKSKKGVWIAVGIVAALMVLAGVAVLLVLLLRGEKDEIRPTVKLSSPAAGSQVELGLPVGTAKEVDVSLTASDNKGLDKVEIMVNDKVVETLKATKATKDSNTGGALKEEDFSYKWSAGAPGSNTLKAKAYDWKGNYGESDPVSVNVVNGPEIEAANSYCQQIDGLITEYVQYRTKFNQAYEGAKNHRISYAEAGITFDQVGDERRALRARLASMTPPTPFAQAQSLFDQQISAALDADNYAIQWAGDMQTNYPYYQAGNITNPDPNDYEGKMLSASNTSQKAAKAFKDAYNGARASQLKFGPGPDPTQ